MRGETLCREFRLLNNLSRTFLLGHSLGGMMAPEIARLSRDLEGILLLGANARLLLEMMEIQLGNKMKRLDEVKNKEEIDQLKTIQQTVNNAMDKVSFRIYQLLNFLLGFQANIGFRYPSMIKQQWRKS